MIPVMKLRFQKPSLLRSSRKTIFSHWNNGMVEYQKEGWNTGMLEYWDDNFQAKSQSNSVIRF
jgi:hypothetical protein